MSRPDMSPLGRELFNLAADMMRVQCAPVAELPPASVIKVTNEIVTACAWCPQRLEDSTMMQRCERYASTRGSKLSHGLCEVCKAQFFTGKS